MDHPPAREQDAPVGAVGRRAGRTEGHHLEGGVTERTEEFLKALASPTRRDIALLFAHGATLSVGEVADRAGVSQSTASQHLAQLRRGGVLVPEREGKTVRYRADRSGIGRAMLDLGRYLDSCC